MPTNWAFQAYRGGLIGDRGRVIMIDLSYTGKTPSELAIACEEVRRVVSNLTCDDGYKLALICGDAPPQLITAAAMAATLIAENTAQLAYITVDSNGSPTHGEVVPGWKLEGVVDQQRRAHEATPVG